MVKISKRDKLKVRPAFKAPRGTGTFQKHDKWRFKTKAKVGMKLSSQYRFRNRRRLKVK